VEQFGLDMFAGLLGRLNGKSETQLQKEENARRDVKLSSLASQRYGSTTFVSGGFLVGEKIEKSVQDIAGQIPLVSVSQDMSTSPSKKRKRDEKATSATDSISKLKSNKRKQEEREINSHDAIPKTKSSKKEKRKKNKGREIENTATEGSEPDTSALPSSASDIDEKAERKQRKAERKARREAKRLRKEKRRKKRAEAADSSSTSSNDEAADSAKEAYKPMVVQPAANGRFLVRQRYIQQKRLACMDQKSLNEIFMIKTPG
jgi:Pin2-interacting protein X1